MVKRFWGFVKMSTALQEYDEKISSLRVENNVLASMSVDEIEKVFSCSQACAIFAKHKAEAEERKLLRQHEAEAEERKLLRQHDLELEKLKADSSARTAMPDYADILGKLLGKPLNEDELRVLLTKYSNYLPAIAAGSFNTTAAVKLRRSIQTTLKTMTIGVMRDKGFVFDRLLGPSGAGKAVLYRVICENTLKVSCGKVYLKGTESADQIEAWASELICARHASKVPHPNIVCYHTVLDIAHMGHGLFSTALLMPLYQISLADIIEAHYGWPIPFEGFSDIALSLLDGGKCFESMGVAHCDIKPDNIMMDVQQSSKPVIIDLGSVTHLGRQVFEHTRFYAMDASMNPVDANFDLNCIATTLACCFVPQFEVKNRKKSDLEEMIRGLSGNTSVDNHVEISLKILKCNACSEWAPPDASSTQ